MRPSGARGQELGSAAIVANFWPGPIVGRGAPPREARPCSDWLLQDDMYATQMFAGGSGAPSPAPYAEQYAQAQYTRAAAPAGFSEPYYREYFGDTYQRPAYEGEAGAERYARPPYHGKGVITGAGLTVDLPSPDSGIGADAVTPRDQPATHQVSY